MFASQYRVGDLVTFTTTIGKPSRGRVIRVLVEKQPPHVLLIEVDHQGRAFRLESEVAPAASPIPSAGEKVPDPFFVQ